MHLPQATTMLAAIDTPARMPEDNPVDTDDDPASGAAGSDAVEELSVPSTGAQTEPATEPASTTIHVGAVAVKALHADLRGSETPEGKA